MVIRKRHKLPNDTITRRKRAPVFSMKNLRLIDVVESYLVWVGSTTDTAEYSYRKPLHNLVDFVGNRLIVEKKKLITLDEISNFLIYLTVKKCYKPRYVNFHINIIKAFLKYCKACDYEVVDRDMIRYRKIEEEDRPVLDDKGLTKLLGSYNKDCKDGMVHYIVTRFIYETMCRVSEVTELHIKDLDFTHQLCSINRKKSKKKDIVSWSEDLNDYLYEYYMWRVRQRTDHDYFFINKYKNKVDVRSIQRWVKSAREKAGIKDQITVHLLRHKGAHELILKSGGDIKIVGSALGHSPDNLAGTAKYIKQSMEEKARQAMQTKVLRFGSRFETT